MKIKLTFLKHEFGYKNTDYSHSVYLDGWILNVNSYYNPTMCITLYEVRDKDKNKEIIESIKEKIGLSEGIRYEDISNTIVIDIDYFRKNNWIIDIRQFLDQDAIVRDFFRKMLTKN